LNHLEKLTKEALNRLGWRTTEKVSTCAEVLLCILEADGRLCLLEVLEVKKLLRGMWTRCLFNMIAAEERLELLSNATIRDAKSWG